MDVLGYLASVVTLGIAAQWLAWRLHLPAILLLLVCGFLLLPVYCFVSGDSVNTNSLIDAEILFPIVSLSVAVILFEGGLTLRIGELKGTANVVFRLVTLGVLVTWVLATWCAWWLFSLPLALAALLGAILTVSGPTVVGPLLRYVRPDARVGSLAKWEGIINDPIGAILAVVVFEAIRIGGLEEAVMAIVWGLVKTGLVGVSVGITVGLVLVQLLKRFLIPDYLQNAVFLAVVIAIFVLSNVIQNESGLLTVTILGIVLANQKVVTVKHVVEFKENLRVLLISTLFILLASRVEWNELKQVGWQGFAFLAVLLLIRPIAVFLSTLRSELKNSERLFLAWLHPRGIVAAAVTSLFALELTHMAEHVETTEAFDQIAEQAGRMVPITFVVIVGTVAVYGLTLGPLARWLGIAKAERRGILFAGAEPFVRAIAKILYSEGIDVLLVDTNQRNIAKARMEGLRTCYASVLSEHVQEELDLSGIGSFLAMTPNDEVNSLAAMEFAGVFGRAGIYQLTPDASDVLRQSQVSQYLRARLLFSEQATSSHLRNRLARGGVIKRTGLSTEFDFGQFQQLYGDQAIVLFVIHKSGQVEICSAESSIEPAPGQTLISLVDEV